ncbi:MAG: M20/M25/M40 family metallo-hydrolase [Planctomycetia bacterium]|nr:M20/M25/M40 family metallo-hydrolase [Planctomycetia bacterium]
MPCARRLLGVSIGIFAALIVGNGGLVSGAELALRLSARNSVAIEDLKAHASVLADDTFEGREAGKRGSRAAAGYIIEKLKACGLKGGAADGTFIQPFDREHRNLLAVMPGNDAALSHEVIIVGAHYDHVGYGNSRNSFGPYGYIHNGADDNASGVAAVLETAQALTSIGGLRRTVVFAFWDAEEAGLFGSKHWIAHPTVPVENVTCFLNLDMIGRLRKNTIEVYGTRTAANLRKIISTANASAGIAMDYKWEIKEDSDHASFFRRLIPTVMFHTGRHGDYHRPSDDVEKLNFEGMQSICRLMVDVVIDLADSDQRTWFRMQSVNESVSDAGRDALERPIAALGPRLGISWRPGVSKDAGVYVSSVRAAGPAGRAGMKQGDRITAWDDIVPASDGEFERLVLRQSGPVKLTIVRPGLADPIVATVTPLGEPVRIGLSWAQDDAEPESVVVKRVVAGSPAAAAGLLDADRIYEVDGVQFRSSAEFEALLEKAGKRMTLIIDRKGIMQTLVCELDR